MKTDDPILYILIEYLTHYLPADPNEDKDVIFKSSLQIQDDLSEIAEIPLNEITSQMVRGDYKLFIDEDGLPKWCMMRN